MMHPYPSNNRNGQFHNHITYPPGYTRLFSIKNRKQSETHHNHQENDNIDTSTIESPGWPDWSVHKDLCETSTCNNTCMDKAEPVGPYKAEPLCSYKTQPFCSYKTEYTRNFCEKPCCAHLAALHRPDNLSIHAYPFLTGSTYDFDHLIQHCSSYNTEYGDNFSLRRHFSLPNL